MGRFGTVEVLAGTVANLASDDAGFVTASALPIEGGITTASIEPSRLHLGRVTSGRRLGP